MNMITGYEVEGAWINISSINKPSKCRNCGAILELAPKENHYNSKYWKLKQNDGLDLACCPNGCSEEDAVNKMEKYLNILEFVKRPSESYKYQLDYSKIRNAWISDSGEFFPVYLQGHAPFAINIDKTELDLENNGWLKISESSNKILFMNGKYPNKKQVEILFDYFIDKGYDTSNLYGDNTGYYFTMEKT